jgi:hypothetical protein
MYGDKERRDFHIPVKRLKGGDIKNAVLKIHADFVSSFFLSGTLMFFKIVLLRHKTDLQF